MKALALFSRSRQPVVYEVRLEIDPAIADEYDDWLLAHVREMLAFPGFEEADVYHGREMTDDNRLVRVAAYTVRSRRELDSYLHTHAKRMRREGEKRFARGFSASRRIVPVDEYSPPGNMATLYSRQDISGGFPICANCHQPVEGRFCANCGQEDRTYVMSVFELVGEFIGELLNFDSKLYRTLHPLLFKPGLLTNEYVRGRRHYYLSPVRMYIFISLVFFFLFALLTDLRFDGLGNVQVNGDSPASAEELTPEQREEVRRSLREAEEQTGIPLSVLESIGEGVAAGNERARTRQAERQEREAAPAEDGENHASRSESERPGIRFGDDDSVDASGFGSEELDQRITRGARALRDDPAGFARAAMQHVPAMMFVFLPLIAMALKVLYIGSRRYYAEHLIFTLHFHSAVFVLLLAWLAFGRLREAWPLFAPLAPWFTAAVWIYIPYYLYRSMRVVYGQGRFFTITKFLLLQVAYLSALITTFVFTLLYTMYQQA